ncbi:MAG: hypothetical protein GY846_11670 [Deltaproteobacteria bacterium]|nr:hypothetical protein [Deltaproteobacteria bacterium]
MIIVFFSNSKSEAAERLLGDIQRKFYGHRIEIAPTVKALREWFHHPMTERIIHILVPENRQQLEELGYMGDLMNDNPIILILPDREPHTVSTGHKLYPRFVSYLDSDFSYVTAVLSRMVENVEDEKKAWKNKAPRGSGREEIGRIRKGFPTG